MTLPAELSSLATPGLTGTRTGNGMVMSEILASLSTISPAILPLVGVFVGAWLTSRATLRSSKNALVGIKLQMALQAEMKLSEFRQSWINNLRDCMAEFQSIGMTPGVEAEKERHFYELGTKIELLMNRRDEGYSALQTVMYRLLLAKTKEEKYSCNRQFVEISQSILKREWEVLKLAVRNAAVQNF
jgi:hypothetical protein